MRKIRLDIDKLAVDSFGTTDAENEKSGTVRAHASLYLPCNSDGSQCATCLYGCPADTRTCMATCMTNRYQVCFCQ